MRVSIFIFKFTSAQYILKPNTGKGIFINEKSAEKKILNTFLKFSLIYDLVQVSLGAIKARRILVQDFIQPKAIDHVLDFGAGTSEILSHLPTGIHYLGIEPNEKYIRTAKKNFLNRENTQFLHGSTEILDDLFTQGKRFDKVLLLSTLHHLSDDESCLVIDKLVKLLVTGGTFIAIDPVFHKNQNIIAKILIKMDRGANVRSERIYKEMFTKYKNLKLLKFYIRKNLMNFPYSHIITKIQST